MTAVEERLRGALLDAAAALDESDDLFARVQLSIEDDRRCAVNVAVEWA